MPKELVLKPNNTEKFTKELEMIKQSKKKIKIGILKIFKGKMERI